MTEKKCSKCKIIKPATLEYFPPNKAAKSGLGSWCRLCYLDYQRSGKMKKYNKEYSRRYYHEYKNTIKGYLIHTYNHMTNRCNNPNDVSYENYGGKGIKCLFSDAKDFVDYVVNELQIDPRGLEVHRIENNKHYERGNIAFLTTFDHRVLHGNNQ